LPEDVEELKLRLQLVEKELALKEKELELAKLRQSGSTFGEKKEARSKIESVIEGEKKEEASDDFILEAFQEFLRRVSPSRT